MGLRRLKCTGCGADLLPGAGATTVTCAYCRTTYQLPSDEPRPAGTSTLPVAQSYLPTGTRVALSIAPVVVVVAVSISMFFVQSAIRKRASQVGVDAVNRAHRQAQEAHEKLVAQGLAPADQGLAHEIDLYVDGCLNRYSERTLESRARYLSWVDAEEGPSAKSRHVYGLFTIYDPDQCTEAVSEANGVSPARPKLHQAALGYANALERVQKLVTDVATYYDRGDYKDDDFAHGKEVHGPLMAAFQAFEAAHRELATEIDLAFDEVYAEQKAKLEKAKNTTGLLALESERSARDIAALVNVSWKSLDDIPLDPLKTRVEGYERQVDELTRNLEEGGKRGAFDELPGYAQKSTALAQAAKELLRRRRDGKPFSSGERSILGHGPTGQWMVDGAPGAVLAKYADVADASPSPRLRKVLSIEVLPSEGARD